MPRTSDELSAGYYEPVAVGPVAQADISAWSALGGPPATIADSGSWTSNLLPTDGYKVIAVGVTSSNAGVLSVQRYLDTLGLVPQGSPITFSLVAATAGVINVMDMAPCQSFTIGITNGSGTTATLTKFACLLNAA